jgi:hypothetical protein
VLAGMTPQDEPHHAALWVGMAQAGGKPPRIRLYANNGWGDTTARWLRLIGALRQLDAGHFAASLQPLMPTLLPVFSPNGFAVTVPGSPLLCKLYLRPVKVPWSAVCALALSVLGPRGAAFLARIEEGLAQPLETLPERSLIVSMAGAASGGPLDLKLDLCGHCLFADHDDARAAGVVDRLARSFGLDRSPYAAMLEDIGGAGARARAEAIAFVGVGGDRAGDDRINIYLTPSRAGA